MDAVGTIVDSYGLPAACLMMLVKAAGVPVPIPGDLILLAMAARAAEGKLVPWQAFLLLLLAIVAGGALQFAVARGPGRGLVYRFGRLAGFGPDRLDSVAQVVRRGGLLGLTVAILTPGLRVAAVPSCGLAGLPLRSFLPALIAASSVDLALHFVLGTVGGSLLGFLQPSPPTIVLGLLAIAAVGLGGWMLILRRRRLSGQPGAPAREALAAWQQTGCPACLVLGMFGAHTDTASASAAAGSHVRL